MGSRDLLLLAYKAFGGKIQRRTFLKKKFYFLALMLGLLDKLAYSPHYFGPYSARVYEANNEQVSLNFIHQTKVSSGKVSSQGFEIARYDYEITEDGKIIAEEKIKKYSD